MFWKEDERVGVMNVNEGNGFFIENAICAGNGIELDAMPSSS